MSVSLFDAPGPRGRRRIMVLNLVGAVVVLGLLGWVLVGMHRQGQLTAEKWSPFLTSSIWQHYLIPGLWATVRAAALATVTAFVFGILFGLGRLAKNGLVRRACDVVVEFFRAVPVLVMMFFFYAVFAYGDLIPSQRAPFFGVVTALTLYNGSVIAELVRSGIQSLPRGQREAAFAIGVTPAGSLRWIELPQALIAMMPSLISQLVIILKDTGLGYLINYAELLRQARLVGSSNANLLPALIVAAVIFIIINNILTVVAERIARGSSRRSAARPVAGVAAAVTATT